VRPGFSAGDFLFPLAHFARPRILSSCLDFGSPVRAPGLVWIFVPRASVFVRPVPHPETRALIFLLVDLVPLCGVSSLLQIFVLCHDF
jgi:hypothetical protein